MAKSKRPDKDALDKLGHTDVGHTAIFDHATELADRIAKARQFWLRRRPL